MQFSLMKSTMPLAYCTIAPGAGQAFRQPGSSQCMQPSLRISHSRLPCSSSHSVKRISVQVLGSRSSGIVVGSLEIADLAAQVVPFHAGGLAGLAADAAADVDQLRHFLLVIADRRRRQGRCRPADVVLRLQIRHRLLLQATGARGLLDVDQERLELRRLRVGVADGRRQRVGAVALARLAGEAPMERHADHMRRLAVHRHRADALGHVGLAHDRRRASRTAAPSRPARCPSPSPAASPISMNSSGCRIALISACLVQKWKCSVSR